MKITSTSSNPISNIRRYSNFVNILKYICAAAAIILVLALIVLPFLKPSNKQLDLVKMPENHGVGIEESKTPKMFAVKPDLLGISNKNGPFNIIAKKVSQFKDRTYFEEPQANLVYKKTKHIMLKGEEGSLANDSNIFTITGNVVAQLDKVHKLFTDKIIADINNAIYKTDDIVLVESGLGKLTARNGFYITGNNKQAKFIGPIDSNITQKSKKDPPINITSKNLLIDDIKQNATYEGEAKLTKDSIRLTSNQITIDYSKDKNNPNYLANGNVLIDDGKLKAYGSSGKYKAHNNTIELYGAVKLVKGKNTILGNNFTYDINKKKGRIISTTGSKDNRVKAIIQPKKK